MAIILMLIGFVDDLGGDLDQVDNPDMNAMMSHVGLLGLHGNFYFVQKILIIATAVYMILSALEVHKNPWVVGFSIIIIIYNVIIPLQIDRIFWLVLDFMSAVFVILSLVAFRVKDKKPDPRKMKMPYLNKPPRF